MRSYMHVMDQHSNKDCKKRDDERPKTGGKDQ
jgi:hypothetical protein